MRPKFYHYILALSLLSFYPGRIWSQNQAKIDSLRQLTLVAKDSQKVLVWNELAWEYHIFNPDQAIEYGEKALGLSQQIQYDRGVAVSLRYIGNAYRTKLDFTRSRKYFFLALPFYEKIEDELGVGQCLVDIGEVYKYRGDYKQALDKYRRAVELFEKVQYKEGTAQVLGNIADVYYKLAKYQNALKFALQSLNLSQQANTNKGVKDASLILSEAYANVGNYYQAFTYHHLHTSVKDSVFMLEKAKELQHMEEKFERERRETQAKIQMEKAVAKAKRDKQRRDNIQYSFIFIIFIILFAVIFALGKFDIPQNWLESLIFLTLLLLFRFVLIMLMPFADTYAEGSPMLMLFANVILALLFMPLHKFIEKKLRKKVIEEHINDDKIKVNIHSPSLNPFKHWEDRKVRDEAKSKP